MSRRLIPLAAALALGALAPSAAAAQAALALSGMPGPAELKATYHLLLRSTWPQEQAANGCRNGGAETIEGTLARGADGSYSGVLARRTELLFCGVHGSRGAEQAPGASVPRCALALEGQGTVAMNGVVMADESSPSGRSVRVTWRPVAGHEAEVSGACAAAFQAAVREMYLSAPHAAEFPLTVVGTGRRTELLDAYAWEVELD